MHDGNNLPDSDNRIALSAVRLQQTKHVGIIAEASQDAGSTPATSTKA